MYKLVIVGGPLRGREYNLSEGENSLGSDPSNFIALNLGGISKNHLKIIVNGETAYIEDLKSSNGTFVNGKLVQSAPLKNKDQIALPNLILQVVYVQEKKIIIKKKVVKVDDDKEHDFDDVPAPNHFTGKAIHFFRYRAMNMAYAFNQEYEWKAMIAFFLAVFILITVALTIFPVLSDNKRVLTTEVMRRGFHYADVIAQYNTSYLSRKDYDAVDTRFLDNEQGVEVYELIDSEGRIIRPISRLNEYSNDTFVIETLRTMREKSGVSEYNKLLGSGRFGIARAIKSYNIKKSSEEIVAIIAIKFAPQSLVLEAANNSKAYLESFSTSAIVAILFFGAIYFLTLRNLDDLQYQMEQVLRGKQKELGNKYLFSELTPLKNSINSLLQKYLEIQGERSGGEFAEVEEDIRYVETLKEFLLTTHGPVLILNSRKEIMSINLPAEDLLGIRESASAGQPIFEVTRDQGLSATMIDLCDQSGSAEGRCQKGSYELAGANYEIAVLALIGKDHFAKAFYISFVKEE